MKDANDANSSEDVKSLTRHELLFCVELGKALTAERRAQLEAQLRDARSNADASPAVQAYRSALDVLLPHQRSDFYGLFEAMDGYPVIIRLIDPPWHEFLPSDTELEEKIITSRVDNMASYLLGKGESKEIHELETMLQAVEKLHESNPMMGLRGSGSGGFIQDSCSGYLEGSRVFTIYLHGEPAGSFLCYINHCEGKITLPDSTSMGRHCLAAGVETAGERGACPFEFQVIVDAGVSPEPS